MRADGPVVAADFGLGAKVAFLRRPDAYPGRTAAVTSRETHMSWVFLVGDRVYKLKKPVRFPYLDYSTIERREAACRAELELNRRLAPGVYLDVVPLTASADGLTIGGTGAVADWLVVMRRLRDDLMLDNALQAGAVGHGELQRLADTLVHFYRHARPIPASPEAHLREWRRRIDRNRVTLADPRFGLPAIAVARIDRIQRCFVGQAADLLRERALARRIVEGHGDLRPEHVVLSEPISVIDCIEFNRSFLAVDPFDELAFLEVECERLGFAGKGRYLAGQVARGLHDGVPDALFSFYRCYHATVRARLAAAHLLEPEIGSPDGWRDLSHQYLALAATGATVLDAFLAARRRRPRRCLELDQAFGCQSTGYSGGRESKKARRR